MAIDGAATTNQPTQAFFNESCCPNNKCQKIRREPF